MLGYVQTGNLPSWLTDLHVGLVRRSTILRLIGLPKRINVVALLSDELLSEHRRRAVGTIGIFHILLDCL
jgi:hypothetical protein